MNTRSHHASPLPSKLKTRAKNSPLRISPPKSQISNLKLFPILTLALAATLALSTRHPTRAESQAIPDTIERAVDRGLSSLAHSQEANGTWTSGGASESATAAVTGLAAMAFMARGHTPGQGPYGDNLNRAIDAILTLQQASGLIASRGRSSHPMYEHGICTVALCEAYGMIDEHRQQLALAAIGRAVRVILDAQSIPKGRDNQGGWRYQATSDDSDLSVSGWQLMALRGAANVGASIPQHDLDAGINYVKRRAAASGGFDYQGGSSAPNAALTGTGILALALLGHPDAPEVKAGGDFLLRTPIIQTPSNYFYTVYYCSQAAWQLGGQYWDNINREISSDLLGRQRPDGSWSSSASGDNEGGDNYCTAMAILSLTVPYRYLPIYQR